MRHRMASGRVTFRHHVLPEAHLTDFRVIKGDPAGQAEWDLLAIWVSLHGFLCKPLIQSVVQCDSLLC